MKMILTIVIFLLVFAPFAGAQTASTDHKMDVIQWIDNNRSDYSEVAQNIWEWAELGYQEEKSSNLLQQTLQEAGFKVKAGIADIPTAFVASYGSGQPVIGIMAEFDALPGISQEAVPYRKKRPDCNTGHACGHHLFGAGSTAAAVAVKNWMQTHNIPGTIRLYGTPAEEGGAGKVYMVRSGIFDDVDAMLHWHPGNSNSADAGSSLANKSAKFRFYGAASHAAVAPERGRSALDAVEALNYMVNLMREHVPMESRIHYVITSGGEAPNVVPEFAEVFYYTRHPEMAQVRSIFDRVVKAAEGAALGTGTQMEYEVIHGVFNLLPNQVLGEHMYSNLMMVGGVDYTPDELAFAEKIMESYPDSKATMAAASSVDEFNVIERGGGGSTDVGDVSWVVPTAGMRAATWVPGTAPHSWQAVAAGGMSIGKKGMVVAAKTLALTAIDLFANPKICAKAKQELNRRRGPGFEYQALLGDREPPLDYRN
ncbi:MAG: amidohydrolase [Saprospiraceae bacterium]|nr:amidohydrolase [Saprospiraceae bacterium]